MAWIKELDVGSILEVELAVDGTELRIGQRVTIRMLYKRGRQCRLAIEAPAEVELEVLPPPGVTLAAEGR